ncbi:ATP-binding cassette domain-containing protein [Desulfoscipio geothermicus]|uniref:ATP-binding cassette domain-containing protein n=1 Tax=Desulfoscipio geothermicus TaxID=39060 RepID=UPI000B8833D9|nr:ATP-binding cassette domain-containing protein [Desulfoscipio geothermicus]
MPCIKAEKLTHVYFPGTPLQAEALGGIDLEISRGEFLVLAGASGSGKTTLVMHFNGLLLPTTGRVRVLGGDVTDRSHRSELWRRVGLVFQYPERQIFNLKVFDDIAFGVRNLGIDERAVARRVNEALAMVGLPEKLQRADPKTLSGGALRRVAIAGVLAMRPEVLVLDEPGAGLDPATRKSILRKLKDIQAEYGTTVILITHHLEDAASYADRVAVLCRGRLMGVGDAGQMLGEAAMLRKAGLKAPFAVELAGRLAEAGIQLPGIPLTPEEAAGMLQELLQTVRIEPGGDTTC